MNRAILRSSPCLGRVAVTWALYGMAAALVWEAAGPTAAARGLVWLIFIAAGLALATREL